MPRQTALLKHGNTLLSTNIAPMIDQAEISVESSIGLRFILATFPLPFIIFALSSGNQLTYFQVYSTWVFFANAKLFSIGLFGRQPSHLITFLALILFINFFAIAFIQPDGTVQEIFRIFCKSVLFVNVLYIFDLVPPIPSIKSKLKRQAESWGRFSTLCQAAC